MSLIKWDAATERKYENGVDHVVLYPKTGASGTYAKGVAWNGVTSISENPSGGEANPLYADNIKYLNLMSAEEFGFSIEAYTYPNEFGVCDGSVNVVAGTVPAPIGLQLTQQERKEFGICYRTKVGSDSESLGTHYKLHIVYNCLAAPSSKAYNTINESPEAITFSWDVTTTAEEINNYKPTAHLIIDSAAADQTKLQALLDLLYGTDASESESTTGSDPTLPTIAQVISTLTPTT